MNGHRPALRLAEHVSDAGPELACHTEFSDGDELVVVGHQPEADLAQSVGDIDAGVDQRPHVVDRCTQHAGELPGRVGATVVERRSVDGDGAHPGTAGQIRRDSGDVLDRRSAQAAQRGGERVGAQVDRQSSALRVVGTGHQGLHRLSGGAELGPGLDDHRRELEVDTFQQPVQIGGGNTVIPDAQHQRADPVTECTQHDGIAVGDGAGEARSREHLGDFPAGHDVTTGVSPADERPAAGQRRFRQCVERGVERPDREALVGGRVQQRLGFSGQIRRVAPAALGQHSGHRGAPAGAARLHLDRHLYRHRQLLLSQHVGIPPRERHQTIRLNDDLGRHVAE